jgi:rRNA maturation RNase YbeY
MPSERVNSVWCSYVPCCSSEQTVQAGVVTRGPAVEVTTRGRRAPALAARLRRGGRRLLSALGLDGAELSVLLVSDAEMRRLNRTYRGKDRSTDVLAFAQAEGEGGAPAGLLGDVVISVDTAKRQAAARGASIGRESERLLIHGVLHLLGYDHERSAVEARRMQRRERLLARRLAS